MPYGAWRAGPFAESGTGRGSLPGPRGSSVGNYRSSSALARSAMIFSAIAFGTGVYSHGSLE